MTTVRDSDPTRNPGSTDAAAAWTARAAELAAWADRRLIVRRDCWGAYTPPDRRGQEYTAKDGTVKKVPASYTAKGELTLDVLARHFRGRCPEHVIGIHSTSTDNFCLAARVDIDAHGPDGNDPAANLRAALAWHDRLVGLEVYPLLYGSNGKGGYHLSALFSELVPTPLVFAFLHWITADHAQHGIPVRPEVFPKQPHIAPGKYGNWLRLPGRHHTRDYWSEVWDGARWLSGADAVAFILALQPSPPTVIPATVTPHKPQVARAIAGRRVRYLTVTADSAPLSVRISRYMAKLPNLGEGQGRDDVAFTFAAFLVRDLGLDDNTSLGWLRLWDQNNTPPKGSDRLAEIVKSAHAYGQHAYGCAEDASAVAPNITVTPAQRPGHQILRCNLEVD